MYSIFFDKIKFIFFQNIAKVLLTVPHLSNALNIHKSEIDFIKTNGYLRKKSFLCSKVLNEIDLELSKAISKVLKNNKNEIEAKPGNLRVKRLQYFSPILRKFSRNTTFNFLSFSFYGLFKKPNILFTYTTDGKHSSELIDGGCSDQFAFEPHVDSFRNYLKILLLLEDVEVENGPTYIVPSSMNDPILLSNYKDVIINKSNTIVDEKKSEILVNKYGKVPLTGKAGDIIIINTKNLHWAGDFISGERKILWLYY